MLSPQENEATRRRIRLLRIFISRARALCHAHGLPIVLVSLAAFGSAVHLALARTVRHFPAANVQAYAGMMPSLRSVGVASGVGGRAEAEDWSVLGLEQLNIRECRKSSLLKMRVRILDLDIMHMRRAQGNHEPPEREPSVARLMQVSQPVDQSALHSAEKSHLRKLIRSCELYFGENGVSEDLPERSPHDKQASTRDNTLEPYHGKAFCGLVARCWLMYAFEHGRALETHTG